MQFLRYILLSQEELSEIEEVETETTDGGLLGDVSTNFRIVVMVISAVIIYFITRQLYAVLINREWHPADAKLLVFSTLFVLLSAVFTILFVGKVMLLLIIIVWIAVLLFIVLSFFRRRG